MIKMYIGLHIKYPLFLSDFKETLFSCQIFEKSSNIKFHENPSSGSWTVPRGQRDGWTARRTDIMKLKVGFRNFVNMPKIESHSLPLPSTIQHTNSVQSFNIYESGNTLNNKNKNSYLRDK